MGTNFRKEQIKKMLETEPNDSFLVFALAKELENEENFLEAGKIYEKLLVNDPSYLGLYYHYGKLLEVLQEPDKATAVYKQGIAKCLESNDLHAKSELQTALMNLQID